MMGRHLPGSFAAAKAQKWPFGAIFPVPKSGRSFMSIGSQVLGRCEPLARWSNVVEPVVQPDITLTCDLRTQPFIQLAARRTDSPFLVPGHG